VKKNTVEQFCHDILNFDIKCAKALSNVVMALSSYQAARSPVELSLSPLYHYQYSSLYAPMREMAGNQADYLALEQTVQKLCLSNYEIGRARTPLVLQTDALPLPKPHSPTLENRTYIQIPNNVISTNKPLSIGYQYSAINISDFQSPSRWSIPLSNRRIKVNQTATECALAQIDDLLKNHHDSLLNQLIVNLLDSGYGNPNYLCAAYLHANLVSIVRLRHGSKIWDKGQRTSILGTPKIYGNQYYLIEKSDTKTYKHPQTKAPIEVARTSIFDQPTDDYQEYEAYSKRGSKLIYEVYRWNDLLKRSKNGKNMKDKPMDLIGVRVIKEETGEILFNHTLFATVSGQKKNEIQTTQAAQYYRYRYDIEPYIRFAKQRLLLDKYQSSNPQYMDNWMLVIQLASWVLYLLSDQVKANPHKWEKYNLPTQQPQLTQRLSMAQTRKAAQNFLLDFSQKPFLPSKSKNGQGRKKGQTQPQRTRFKVVRKTTSKEKIKLTTEKIE
jgi:hypothetical protein